MKKIQRISKPKIQTLLITLLLILCGATATNIRAQTVTTPSAADTQTILPVQSGDALTICNQRLSKVLVDLSKSENDYAAKDAENRTNIDLRAKEENYNAELLKAVALLTSSEKRNKSFFQKLRGEFGKVLMSATDPKAITTIVGIILILDKLSK